MQRESSTLYVCLELHRDSIDIAVADAPRDGAIRTVGSIGGDLASLDKALRGLKSRGQVLRTLRFRHLAPPQCTRFALQCCRTLVDPAHPSSQPGASGHGRCGPRMRSQALAMRSTPRSSKRLPMICRPMGRPAAV